MISKEGVRDGCSSGTAVLPGMRGSHGQAGFIKLGLCYFKFNVN